MLEINLGEEKREITSFLKKIFIEQKIDRVVIGLSGGVDSAVSFFLLKEVVDPEKIFVAHLYYSKSVFESIGKSVLEAKVPKGNISLLSIKKPVDEMAKFLGIKDSEEDKLRKGNIAARMRMVILFDLAKKVNGLVCGTENRSENLLGYFTRFGDQASDIEPIAHLYKTQVYALARSLGVPKEIITQQPTAGLWVGQTDEGELGFSYAEADEVLYWYFEKKLPIEEILKKGYEYADRIIARHERNMFKHKVPYSL